MPKTKHILRSGVTLVELVIASAATVIVFLGVAVLIVDGQRGWRTAYDRTYGDVITDGHVATKRFDAIMRKATAEGFSIDADGSWVEVHYYHNDSSADIDRYARLSESNGELEIEYGQLEPRSTLVGETLVTNVSACTFTQVGQSVHMVLTLDDGTRTNQVVCCGYMHN